MKHGDSFGYFARSGLLENRKRALLYRDDLVRRCTNYESLIVCTNERRKKLNLMVFEKPIDFHGYSYFYLIIIFIKDKMYFYER